MAAMDQIAVFKTVLNSDRLRRQALKAVAALRLPDCWIGAGLVRDAIWDYLHGYGIRPPCGDVDVVWFASDPSDEETDHCIEHALRSHMPCLTWSVKNQARMHLRNGDGPYRSVADAMGHWPETATAVAARFGGDDEIEVNSPFGLSDLFGLKLRPTPVFATQRLIVYQERISSKRWVERYPLLTVADDRRKNYKMYERQ